MDTLDAFKAIPGKIDALVAAVAALERRLGELTPAAGEFLTRKQAVQLTGLSKTTIDKMQRTGRLPVVRQGRRVLIRRKDLLAAVGGG